MPVFGDFDWKRILVFPILIGALSGIAGICLHASIDLLINFSSYLSSSDGWSIPYYILPPIGALIAGIIVYKLAAGAAGAGDLNIVNHYFSQLTIPKYSKPALGGLFMGIVAYFSPQSIGVGYEWIQDMIFSELTLTVILILLIGKILATSFTIGSGGSGGLFAPSLVIGAAVAYILTGKESIYPAQVENRYHSPTLRGELAVNILEDIPVRNAMTSEDIITFKSDNLESCLQKLVVNDIGRILVVDRDEPTKLVGLVTKKDIIKAHARAYQPRPG